MKLFSSLQKSSRIRKRHSNKFVMILVIKYLAWFKYNIFLRDKESKSIIFIVWFISDLFIIYFFITFMKLSLMISLILFILTFGDNKIKYKKEKIIKLFFVFILLIIDWVNKVKRFSWPLNNLLFIKTFKVSQICSMIDIFICFIFLCSIELFINNSIYLSNFSKDKFLSFSNEIKMYFILIDKAFWLDKGILFEENNLNIWLSLFIITRSNCFNFSSASFILCVFDEVYVWVNNSNKFFISGSSSIISFLPISFVSIF